MRAVVNERYGSPDVLELREVPAPQPRPNEIQVRVHATTVGRTDACALRAHPFFIRIGSGLLRPKRKILGLDFAGVVETAGSRVENFRPGDRVFGLTPGGYGAHAQFVCVPADGAVAVMPPGTPFAEAVVGEGAWYANTYLERFGLAPGHRILIYGASGAIGTSAVQLSKARGAVVTAVAPTPHLELARRLGADRVVDYTVEDFTQLGERYDFVLDAVGKTTYFQCRPLLKPSGVFAATDLGPWWQNIVLSTWSSLTRSGRVVMPMPISSQSFVELLRDLIAAGEFQAVIDRTYPLSEIAEAYRFVELAQKAGIVVVEVVPQPEESDSAASRSSRKHGE